MKLTLLYARDRGICHICGEFVEFKDASQDHLIPRIKLKQLSVKERIRLGQSGLNVALAHKLCNHQRGHTELEKLPEITYLVRDGVESYQIHPFIAGLTARKNYIYCQCHCQCKIQMKRDSGKLICETRCSGVH